MIELTPSQLMNYAREALAISAERSKMELMTMRTAIVSSFKNSDTAEEWLEKLDQLISGQPDEEESEE